MLDPQPVAPGFARRWTLQAARQLRRHASVYVLLLALPVLPALFASHDPWRTLTGALLGPFALRLSLQIAVATLPGPIAPDAWAGVLRAAIRGTLDDLRRHARRLLLLTGVFAVAILAVAAWPVSGSDEPVLAPDGGPARTVALFLPVAAQLFVGLTLVHGISPGTSLMASLLAASHRIDEAVARRAVGRALRQSPRAFLFLDQALHVVTFAVVVGATPLAPFALAALPALVTAAMREIFGPRDRESAPQPKAQSGWRPVGGAGST